MYILYAPSVGNQALTTTVYCRYQGLQSIFNAYLSPTESTVRLIKSIGIEITIYVADISQQHRLGIVFTKGSCTSGEPTETEILSMIEGDCTDEFIFVDLGPFDHQGDTYVSSGYSVAHKRAKYVIPKELRAKLEDDVNCYIFTWSQFANSGKTKYTMQQIRIDYSETQNTRKLLT